MRDRRHRTERLRHWEALQSLPPAPTVLTPSAEEMRLKTWIPLYEKMGVSLLYPDCDLAIPPGSTPKEPSVGFYTAVRLLHEQIPLDINEVLAITTTAKPKCGSCTVTHW